MKGMYCSITQPMRPWVFETASSAFRAGRRSGPRTGVERVARFSRPDSDAVALATGFEPHRAYCSRLIGVVPKLRWT